MTDAELAAIEEQARSQFFEDFWAHAAITDLVAEVRRLQDILNEHRINACGCSTRVDWTGRRVECCEACA